MACERRPCADDRPGCLRVRGQIRSDAIPRECETMSVDVVSFGCRLNAYGGGGIRRQRQTAGLVDTFVINKWTVTAATRRQSRETIASPKRQVPSASIGGRGGLA